MTDVRQGVTPTQHAILDKLRWLTPSIADMSFDEKWRVVRIRVGDLSFQGSKRDNLITAAAILISAIEEMGE